MKLITPLTILNQNFNEMDQIRDEMKNRRLEIERLYDDHKKIYKNHQLVQSLINNQYCFQGQL